MISFIYGTVHSGKSEMVRRLRDQLETTNKPVYIFKSNGSDFDYSVLDGFEWIHTIIIDDAHLMTKKQIRKVLDIATMRKCNIVAYGLKTNIRGNMFDGAKWWLSWADDIHCMLKECWCGQYATRNALYYKGKVYRDAYGLKISDAKSVCLCRKHWEKRQYEEISAKDRRLGLE